MYQRIKASRKNESGFTLIELLIVVVILGILAAVVIFASAGFKNKGAAESCKTTVSSVKTAVEAFHVDNALALFPSSWNATNPITSTAAATTSYFDANGVTGTPPVAGTTWLISGKGWNFNVKFGATAAAATGSPDVPEFLAGTLPKTVPDSVCTTA